MVVNVCRLCLEVKEEPLSNIIASTLKCSDLTLVDSLYWVFGVEVNVCDPFSKVICRQCIDVVKYVGNFRKVFQRNQKILEEKKDLFESYRTNTSLPFKDVDTFFVKNTFTIENVRESHTSAKKIKGNYVTEARNQLELSSEPIIILSRLEDSNTYKEYMKINDTLYKKIAIASKDGGKRAIVKDVDINSEPLPVDRFSHLPIICITRFEESDIYKDYEKIDDVTYKKIVNLSRDDTEETRDTGTVTNLNSDEANIEILVNPVNYNRMTVPVEIFKHFCFPSIIIPRLENSKILKEYERVDDTTYKELKEVSVKSGRSSGQLNFIKYYYSFPTFALQELINERKEVISGCKKIIKHPKRICDKTEPLFKIEDVYRVEVCKYCSKVFKSGQMLDYHYKIKHTQFSKYKNNMIKSRKRQKRRAKWKKTKLRTTKSIPIKKTKQLTTGPINEQKSERLLRNRGFIPNEVPSHTVLSGITHKLSKISELLNTTNQIEHKNFTADYEHFPNLKFVKDNKGDKLVFRKRKVTRANQKLAAKSGNLNLDIKTAIKTKTIDLGTCGDQNNVKNTAQEEIQLQATDKKKSAAKSENLNLDIKTAIKTKTVDQNNVKNTAQEEIQLQATDNQQQLRNLHKSDLPEIILDNKEVKKKAINKNIVILGNVNIQNSLSNQSRNCDKNVNEKCFETTKVPSNDIYSLNQHHSINSNTIKNSVNEQSLDNIAKNKLSREINEKFNTLWQQTTNLPYVNNINIAEKDSFMLKRKYQREAEHPKKKKRHKKVATEEGNVNRNITELSGMMSLIEIRDREQATDSVPVNETCCFINKNLHTTDKQQSQTLPVLASKFGTSLKNDNAIPSDLEMPSLEPQNGLRPATPNDLPMPLLEKEVVEKVDAIPLQMQLQDSAVVKIIQNSKNVPEICHSEKLGKESSSCSPPLDNISINFERREINILDDMPDTLPNENGKQTNAIKDAELSDFYILYVLDNDISEPHNINHCSDIIKNDSNTSNSKSDEVDCESQRSNLPDILPNENGKQMRAIKDAKLSDFCIIDKDISESYNINHCNDNIKNDSNSKSNEVDCESQRSNLQTLIRNRRSYITKRRNQLQQSKKVTQDTPSSKSRNAAIKENNPDVMLSNFCGIGKKISESYHINKHQDQIYVSKSDEAYDESQSSNSETLKQNRKPYVKIRRNELEQSKEDTQHTLPSKNHNVAVKENSIGKKISESLDINEHYDQQPSQQLCVFKSKSDETGGESQETFRQNRRCYTNKRRNALEQRKKDTQDMLPSKSHNVAVKENDPNVMLSNFCGMDKKISESCYINDQIDVLNSNSDGTDGDSQSSNSETLRRNRRSYVDSTNESEQRKEDTQDTLPSKSHNVSVKENNPVVMLSNFCGIDKKISESCHINERRDQMCVLKSKSDETEDESQNPNSETLRRDSRFYVDVTNESEQRREDSQDTLPSKSHNVAVKENNPVVMLSNFCGIDMKISESCHINERRDQMCVLKSKSDETDDESQNPNSETLRRNIRFYADVTNESEQRKEDSQDTLPSKSHNVAVMENNPVVMLSNFCGIDEKISESCHIDKRHDQICVLKSNSDGTDGDSQSSNSETLRRNRRSYVDLTNESEQRKEDTQDTLSSESRNVAVKVNNPDVMLSNFCSIDKKISESCHINERRDQMCVLKSKSDEIDGKSRNPNSETLKQIWANIRNRKGQLLRNKDPESVLPSESHVATNENNSDEEILKSDDINKCYDHVECDSKSKSNKVTGKNQSPNLKTRYDRTNVGKRKELEKCKRNLSNTPPSGSHDVVANENYSNVLLSNFSGKNQEISKAGNINKYYEYVGGDSKSKNNEDGKNQRPNLESQHNWMSNVKNREGLKQCKGEVSYTLPSRNISERLLSKLSLINQKMSKSNNISKCYNYVEGASKRKSDEADGENPKSNLGTQQNKMPYIRKRQKEIEQLKKDQSALQSEVVKNIAIDHDYGPSILLSLDQ